MSFRTILPITIKFSPDYQAVESIYESAFQPEEKIPFSELFEWLYRPNPYHKGALWGLSLNGRILGFGSFVYYRNTNIGYLAYLATLSSERSQGHGKWLCESMFAEIEAIAFRQRGLPLRLTFWEVRHPDETLNPAERTIRNRRIHFYRQLGADILPIEYLCPPVGPGLPELPYLLMVRTTPVGKTLSRPDAFDVAATALIHANGVAPTSHFVTRALASIERNWNESLLPDV